MGKDATASLSYGFIIPQPKVLEVLQNLQNSTEKVEEFGYGNGVELLEKLLLGHLNERFEGEFDMVFLTAGDYDFEGLAILYKGVGKRVTVWGFGSESTSHTISASQFGPSFNVTRIRAFVIWVVG